MYSIGFYSFFDFPKKLVENKEIFVVSSTGDSVNSINLSEFCLDRTKDNWEKMPMLMFTTESPDDIQIVKSTDDGEVNLGFIDKPTPTEFRKVLFQILLMLSEGETPVSIVFNKEVQ